jgi:hypothetical protein
MQIPDERAKQIIDLLEELSYVAPSYTVARIEQQKKYLRDKLLPAHAY